MPGQTGRGAHAPGPRGPAGDDVDHASTGTAAVERRRRPLYNLDVVDIGHVDAAEVYIVHCLAGKPLAVDQKEHRLAPLTVEVQVRLLVHGIRELHAGQFLPQKILYVGGVGGCDIPGRDQTCLHGRILEGPRRAGSRHHNLVQVNPGVIHADGVSRFSDTALTGMSRSRKHHAVRAQCGGNHISDVKSHKGYL